MNTVITVVQYLHGKKYTRMYSLTQRYKKVGKSERELGTIKREWESDRERMRVRKRDRVRKSDRKSDKEGNSAGIRK